MRKKWGILIYLLFLGSILQASELSPVLFRASFDTGVNANFSHGSPKATVSGALLFEKGKKGKAVVVGEKYAHLSYEVKGNLIPQQGSISFWLKAVDWQPSEKKFHVFFVAQGKEGWLQFYTHHLAGLTFLAGRNSNTWRAANGHLTQYKKGEWHFLTATWSQNLISVYVDGKVIGKLDGPGEKYMPQNLGKTFKVGDFPWATGRKRPRKTLIDEFTIYRYPLTEVEVKRLYAKETGKITQSYLPPIVSIGKVAIPPTIDGVVSQDEWKGTSSVTGFLSAETLSLAGRQTTVKVCYDDENLYFLYQSPVDTQIPLRAEAKGRDSRVWDDDAIELYLNVPGTGIASSTLYQFVGNSIGTIFDRRQIYQKGWEAKWDGNWVYANKVQKGVWTAELKISFESLGIKKPQKGEVWRVNFCRDWRNPKEWTAWPLLTNFSDVQKMGFMEFAGEGPLVGVENFGSLIGRRIEFSSFVKLPSSHKLSSVRALLTVEREGVEIGKQSFPVRGKSGILIPLNFNLPFKEIPDTFRFKVKAKKKLIYRSVIPFTLRDVMEIKLLPLPSKGICKVTVKVLDIDMARKNSGIKVEVIKKSSQNPLQTLWIRKIKLNTGYGEINLASLPPGDYLIKARLKVRSKMVAEISQSLTKPPEPWRGTHVGVTEEVLPPWIPIQVKRNKGMLEISLWGRRYSFQSNPFPSNIITRGKQILASPIQWQANYRGKLVKWNLESMKLEKKTPSVVIFRTRQSSPSLEAETLTKVEYDGMVWCESTLTPKGNRKLDSLKLLIPLKAEHFRFRQFPGNFMASGTNHVEEGKEYIHKLPNFGYCWMGDEERGLTWFFVNPHQFMLNSPYKALSISHSGKVMSMKINFLDHPIKMEKPLKLAFGFQATPTRPLPKDFRMRGTQRWIGENWFIPWTFEIWTKYGGGYPESNNPEYYRTMLNFHRRQGAKIVPYVVLNWRDRNSPEWKYNRYEWDIPGAISNYSEKRKFWHGIVVCPESESYRDWITYMIKKFVEDYQLDGLYHDLQWPNYCTNPYHGCGEGRINTLGARKLNRRVYTILHSFPRPMMKIDHSSNTLCDPIDSFSDAVVSGEEMCAPAGVPWKKLEPWRVTTDYFKIPDIRGHLIASGMVSGQRGPIPWFLPEFKGGGKKGARGLMALLLPLDVWTLWNGSIDWRVSHKLWRAAKDFGLGKDDVKFTGYWHKDLLVRGTFVSDSGNPVSTNKAPIISIWSRGRRGALVVVANHSTTEDGVAEITFNLSKLHLLPGVEIADAESRLKWYPSDGKVLLPVKKKDYRLIWLKPSNKETRKIPQIPQIEETQFSGYMPTSSGKGDITVGKIQKKGITKFAQIVTFDKPVRLNHIRVFITEEGKMRDFKNPVLRKDETDMYTLNEPEINIVRVGKDGLPSKEIVVPYRWITWSEARPGWSRYRSFFYDRLVNLEPGVYAFIFSKKPESKGKSHTFRLRSYPSSLLPGSYGAFFDGRKWIKMDKIIAMGIFGYVRE